jgi:hypothetical protein
LAAAEDYKILFRSDGGGVEGGVGGVGLEEGEVARGDYLE